MLDEAILPRRGAEQIVTKWGTLEDIMATIMMADKDSQEFISPQIAEKYRSLKYRDTARKVWQEWKNLVQYKEDPKGKQIVQGVAAFWANRKKEYGGTGAGGDCKSFSIACAAIFKKLGIPYKYRFIAEQADQDLHHVYLIVDEDIPVDCVYDRFDAEIPHEKEVDVYPDGTISVAGYIQGPSSTLQTVSLETITSLDQPGSDIKSIWKPVAAIVAIGFITYKIRSLKPTYGNSY